MAQPSLTLPTWMAEPLRLLEAQGQVWAVGGYVRDQLLGVQPGDLDLACSLPASKTTEILEEAGIQVIPTGIKHGTVTAMIEGNQVEITTFRTDGTYSDGRHPDQVSPAKTIEEDLGRRDFTINAIAWHPERGLVDPYGGQADLARRTIRSVGDPKKRFREDALRILRGLRFASQLGFDLDGRTAAEITRSANLLQNVSAERIAHEMTGLLLGTNVAHILLHYQSVFGVIIPQLKPCFTCPQITPYHCYNVWEHMVHAVEVCPADPLLRWTALLHDVGKPASHVMTDGRSHFYGHAKVGEQMAKEILTDLHFPTRFVDDVSRLVRFHDDQIPVDKKHLARFVRKINGRTDLLFALCDMKVADSMAHAPEYREPRATQAKELKALLRVMMEEGEPFSLKDLAIDGNNLMAHGYAPGPQLGAELNRLLDLVMAGEVENTPEALVAAMNETTR